MAGRGAAWVALVFGVLLTPAISSAAACPAPVQLDPTHKNDQYLIRAIFPGTQASLEEDPPENTAYIELRAPYTGQYQVNGSKLQLYDASNHLVSEYVFNRDVTYSNGFASILIATSDFATVFGRIASSWEPDFVTPLAIPLRGGKLCYRSGQISPAWVDCVAWGNYTGGNGVLPGERVGNVFQPLLGLRRSEALVRKFCDSQLVETNDSASDFMVEAPGSVSGTLGEPRNNFGCTNPGCQPGLPVRGICGNGVIEGLEECDDAQQNGLGACLQTCRLAMCGDGAVQSGAGEDCEPPGTATCASDCQFIPAACGDRKLDTGEECDDGNDTAGDGCAPDCSVERCGDGDIQAGAPRHEECDDGNTTAGDGCNASCKSEYCGDHVTQAGLHEGCDDGNLTNGDGCSSTCAVESCGDKVVQSGPPRNEQCDDGNQVTGDGCNALCKEEICGDGTKQTALGEACDDGNTFDDDDCSNECTVNRCGDGITQSRRGELCDDANQALGDGCTPACVREFCGDHVVQELLGEECDDGNELEGDGCSPDCQSERCGDGVIQEARGEECDDRNSRDGDGCSRTCKEEKCGDEVVQGGLGETCDDGNTTAGDGCSDSCTTESVKRRGCTSADPFGAIAGLLASALLRRRRR